MMRGQLMEMVTIDLSETAQWRSAFRDSILSVVRPLWRGQIDYYQAYEVMDMAITNGLTRAWWDGAGQMGIAPNELSPAERAEMHSTIMSQRQYIHGFLQAIEDGSRAEGGKLGPLRTRAELWIKRYDDVKQIAKAHAGRDQKLRWIRDARDSCNSCIRLEGQVRRASYWNEHVMPNSPDLDCVASANGIPVCKCELVPTDKRCTPGPLPMGL